ncbi:MAG: D-alanine--D-alanine ligase [Chitinispirillaceae bacterium]|nr:D-alanine--D-alanine ligase [Chitinispirillaceae bacterium]
MSTKVCIVMGGPSAEYEISLKSGIEVIKNINKKVYSLRIVIIDKEKYIYYCDISECEDLKVEELKEPQKNHFLKGPFNFSNAAEVWEGCKAAFLALHGSFGEDGTIQGYLDTIGLPYTGSGIAASAIGMNKIISKYLFAQSGLDVPSFFTYNTVQEIDIEKIVAITGLPCFVKCPQSGSSKLMGMANSKNEILSLIEEFRSYTKEILIEKYIRGIEFTCGVLENERGEAFALPPVEIRPKAVFFDYKAKYTDRMSEEIVPAPREDEILRKIKETALIAHKVIGCRDISRTDMILSDNKLYVLEINTLPGLTSQSLIPRSYIASGGSLESLIDLLLKNALYREKR